MPKQRAGGPLFHCLDGTDRLEVLREMIVLWVKLYTSD